MNLDSDFYIFKKTIWNILKIIVTLIYKIDGRIEDYEELRHQKLCLILKESKYWILRYKIYVII